MEAEPRLRAGTTQQGSKAIFFKSEFAGFVISVATGANHSVYGLITFGSGRPRRSGQEAVKFGVKPAGALALTHRNI